MALAAIPIKPFRLSRGNAAHPEIRRISEDESETFKIGTPVVTNGSGQLIESPTISSALKIAGFAAEPASNLTTEGTPEHTTEGSVQNQTNAVIIPGGAKPNDGRCGVYIAGPDVEFIGAFYNDTALATPGQANVGNIYGLTKQSNGFWGVDSNITAAASGAICFITEIPVISGNPQAPATPVPGNLVVFKITQAAWEFTT